MANQPKKYKKFVATAATATLVASAIVPVASADTIKFSDVQDSSEFAPYIYDLAEKEVMSGAAGKFNPKGEVTRSAAVKTLGKWLVNVHGEEIPEDYNTVQRFNDLPVDYKDQELLQYAALVKDLGVFSGAAGNLNPSGTLNREQMAKVVVEAYSVVEGVSIVDLVADFDSKLKDLDKVSASNVDYVKVFEKYGITTVDTFNPKGKIQRQHFAKFLSIAINDETLAEDAAELADGGEPTPPGPGLEEIEKEITAAVMALVTTEVTKENAKEVQAKLDAVNAKIAEAEALVAASETLTAEEKAALQTKLDGAKKLLAPVAEKVAGFLDEKPAPTTPDTVAIESAQAINAKTIEVKFNAAVVDTTKATLELLRGTLKQNFTPEWSEDKKSVKLVAASNLQPADYTVNITGLGEATLTKTVKVEQQKVESIEILSTTAVVSATPNAVTGFASSDSATTGYIVKDQYGTDITKSVTLTTNDNNGGIVASNGTLTVTGNVIAGKKVGDLIPVVLIDATSGKSTTASLTLSAKAVVTDIAVAGIFNAKGEAVQLNDKSVEADAFIVLDLKDQYGKEITKKANATGLTFRSTNTNNLTIDETNLHDVKIGDKDKVVIKITDIKQAGDTDVLLISTTNGKSTTFKVSVAETAVVDTIATAQPELVVENEEVLIPLTLTDKQGNVVTDRDLIASAKGVKLGNTTVDKAKLVVKDGQVYYKHTFVAAGPGSLVFTTSTNKVSTFIVDVKPAVKATTIRGFKTPLVISTAQGSKAITPAQVVIEDQYGRVIPATHTAASSAITVSLVGTSEVVSVAGNTVTAVKNGTATLKIALVTQNGTIDSSVEQTVRVTDGTEYASYEIAEIGLTQAGTAKEYTVNGLLNGGKVKLNTSEYTIAVSGGNLETASSTDVAAVTATAGKLNFANALLNDAVSPATGKVDTEFTVKVTVNATGQVLEQKVVVSAKPAVAQQAFFTATAATTDTATIAKATALTEAVAFATTADGATVAELLTIDENDDYKAVYSYTVDQYGTKAVSTISAKSVTIVPEKASEVTITGNGTAAAEVKLKAGITKANVTFKVTIGNTVVEIPVVLDSTITGL